MSEDLKVVLRDIGMIIGGSAGSTAGGIKLIGKIMLILNPFSLLIRK